MNCPVCKERLFMGGNIWIENSEPVTSGTCFKCGVIKFKLGGERDAAPDDASTGAITLQPDMRD